MCTVSFVKTANKVIITSNRDESVVRLALPPAKYRLNNKSVLYPKDPKAGGTWYVVDEKGTVLVLLNGAQEKHLIAPPYRKSRGIIVLDMIGSDSPIEFWNLIDLDAIEPFTLVLFQDQKLYQLRWNGDQKETTALDTSQSYIWASSTLYPAEVRQKRTELFHDFLTKNNMITPEDLYQFHRYGDADNLKNGLVINRDDILKTLSITQTVLETSELNLTYHDLVKGEQAHSNFLIT